MGLTILQFILLIYKRQKHKLHLTSNMPFQEGQEKVGRACPWKKSTLY